jgi:c-di-GMP-related signal transduction protein
MDMLVARQAIFDQSKKVVGYELLFRAAPDASQSSRSDLLASTHVLSGGFFDIGIDRLLDGRKAFVNVPGDLLISEMLRALPPDVIALEILETVVADSAILDACRELKHLGFTLVLDDYTGQIEAEPLLRWVDWVKVDFRSIQGDQAFVLSQKLSRMGKALLAEKVETEEEFEAAAKAGYSYFQGYFLHRPRIVVGHSVPTRSIHLLRLLSLLSAPDDLDLRLLEAAISQDVGLTLKLIRYSNSARFGGTVSSLRQCLVRLGLLEIRRCISILAFPHLSAGECPALIQQAVVRGRMCENLAVEIGRDDLRAQAFLTGMFSLLDAIMRVPMSQIVRELTLSSDVEAALLHEHGSESRLGALLRAVESYEMADLQELSEQASRLLVTMPKLGEAYVEAIQWAAADHYAPRKLHADNVSTAEIQRGPGASRGPLSRISRG